MNWTLTAHRRWLLGLILVGVGVVLLAVQFFGGTTHYLWPFFIIAPGAALVAVALGTGREMRKLAVPGTIITGLGLILFFQNLFNYYESWAYVWALIPFFVGLGMMLAAEEEAGEEGSEAARHLMTWSLTVFVIFAALFELFIFDGGVFAARIVLPVLLILAGAAFLLGWVGPRAETHGDSDTKPGPQP